MICLKNLGRHFGPVSNCQHHHLTKFSAHIPRCKLSLFWFVVSARSTYLVFHILSNHSHSYSYVFQIYLIYVSFHFLHITLSWKHWDTNHHGTMALHVVASYLNGTISPPKHITMAAYTMAPHLQSPYHCHTMSP